MIVPQRPVARVDGRPITLQAYTDALAYRENVLLAQYEQAQRLALQPTPAAGTRAGRRTSCASSPSSASTPSRTSSPASPPGWWTTSIDEQIVRAAAAQRGITATPAEIEAQPKTLLGYQDPSLTPAPPPPPAPPRRPRRPGGPRRGGR